MADFQLNLRRRELYVNDEGNHDWRDVVKRQTIAAERVGLILCDVWSYHYCAGALNRLGPMVPRMNQTLCAARDKGAVIIHAPSNLMQMYADNPARQRAVAIERAPLPPFADHDDPPPPVPYGEGNECDTPNCPVEKKYGTQHPGIEIHGDHDYILEEGELAYSVARKHNLERVIILGVHTNYCILHRQFGIKNMVRWGIPMALMRDLTDTMYNPATRPYVGHDEGTQLVIRYIESFWCPSLLSDDVAG
jgi:nicotinamidase-related amidase